MDLSAAVHHQLHHRFLNHHHHSNNHNHNHQEMDSESLDSIIASSKQQQQSQSAMSEGGAGQQEKSQGNSTKPRPADEEAQKCPRCESTNTKFCYYNNYSLTQPRYFCKSCRRYWTKGGTLRNVPVGGGCRKSNKRPSSPSSLLLKRPHLHIPPASSNPNYAPPLLPYSNDHSLLPHPHPHHADSFSFLDSLRHNGPGLFHSIGYGDQEYSNIPYGGGEVVKQEGGALWGFPWHLINGATHAPSSSDGPHGLIANSASAWQGFINSPPSLLL